VRIVVKELHPTLGGGASEASNERSVVRNENERSESMKEGG